MSKALAPTRPRRLALRVAIALASTLAGCAVGPDFVPPAPPQVGDATHPYTSAALPAATASAAAAGGAAQRFTLGQDVPALWWQLFRSPALDQLIRTALEHSPTLAAAQAALRQAQELYAADAGARSLPAVTGQAGAARQRASQAASNVPGGHLFNLYNASVNVSYTVDAFGATGASSKACKPRSTYQRYQVEAATLSLTANLVTTAVQEASLRAQLQATHEVIAAQQRSLAVIEKQASLGAVAQQPVLAQRTQLAQTRTTLPALEKALAQTRQQLAVLCRTAAQRRRLAGVRARQPAAAAGAAAEPALVAGAPAPRHPRQPRRCCTRPARRSAWPPPTSIRRSRCRAAPAPRATQLAQAVFRRQPASGASAPACCADVPRRCAAGPSAAPPMAAYDQALAQYRQTVLNAFLNVADTLRALDSDARTLQAQAGAEALARETLDLVTQRQYQLGAVSYARPARRPAAACSRRGIGLCRRRPPATPTPQRCSRPWAAAGGTARLARPARRSRSRPPRRHRRHRTESESRRRRTLACRRPDPPLEALQEGNRRP